MDYCKYHPLSPATYACHNCEITCCDVCVDDENRSQTVNCFLCDRSLTSLGSSNMVTPFWRRLDESFKYPLKLETILLIVGIAILSTIVSYLPFSLIFALLILAALVKYCFTCLQNTSQGEMFAPDINEAFTGGLKILGYLLLMIIIVAIALSLSNYLLGVAFTRFLFFIIIISIPAIIINFALTESLLDAINPLKIYKLVTSIGLPYGLLLAFILIMMASISVIQHLVSVDYSAISIILQSVVSNYYMIVIFHLMGYIIFQFQKELGFAARESYGDQKIMRTKYQWLSAKIDVQLKEGNYKKVLELFKWSLRGFSDNESFKKYFDFLLATKNIKEIDVFASSYFGYLDKSNQLDKTTFAFKKIIALNPNYKPNSAKLRLSLAQACYEKRDPKSAVKLINGIHKEFPDSNLLSSAYELMAKALEDIPNAEAKAEQCRKLASHFKSKNQ
jgi:hypothetical protein